MSLSSIVRVTLDENKDRRTTTYPGVVEISPGGWKPEDLAGWLIALVWSEGELEGTYGVAPGDFAMNSFHKYLRDCVLHADVLWMTLPKYSSGREATLPLVKDEDDLTTLAIPFNKFRDRAREAQAYMDPRRAPRQVVGFIDLACGLAMEIESDLKDIETSDVSAFSHVQAAHAALDDTNKPHAAPPIVEPPVCPAGSTVFDRTSSPEPGDVLVTVWDEDTNELYGMYVFGNTSSLSPVMNAESKSHQFLENRLQRYKLQIVLVRQAY